MMDYEITHPHPNDIRDIAQMVYASFGGDFEYPPGYQQRLEGLVQNQVDDFLYVAHNGIEPLGLLDGGIEERVAAPFTEFGRIYYMCVHPDFQRMGIGTSLVGRFASALHAYRIPLMNLTSLNAGSSRFYDAIGFIVDEDSVHHEVSVDVFLNLHK